MTRQILTLSSLIFLASCAPMDGETRTDPALAGPAVKTVGEAKSCISIGQIRESRVRSDQVIDFEMRGRSIYRSVLPRPCPRLGFERAFTYETSINQLCKQDIIYVLEQVGGNVRRGAGCGLGEFVPVEYIEETAE